MTWTDNDQARASKRGWFISNMSSLIRAVDGIHQDVVGSKHKFEDDEAARTHVLNRAFNGDRLCRKAIRHSILNQ